MLNIIDTGRVYTGLKDTTKLILAYALPFNFALHGVQALRDEGVPSNSANLLR